MWDEEETSVALSLGKSQALSTRSNFPVAISFLEAYAEVFFRNLQKIGSQSTEPMHGPSLAHRA